MVARSPARGGFLNAIDLAIHETGHLLFAPLGEVLGVLGGTILQLALPATFVVYFARRRERFSAMVPLWWVGQNLVHVSVYVRDARTGLLPLVGGGLHDWTYLLGRWDLLRYDQVLAGTLLVAGLGTMLGAVVLAFRWRGEGFEAEASLEREMIARRSGFQSSNRP